MPPGHEGRERESNQDADRSIKRIFMISASWFLNYLTAPLARLSLFFWKLLRNSGQSSSSVTAEAPPALRT